MLTLKAEMVSKIYQAGETAVHAVDNVSLGVEKGEIIVILGKSRSGKSTFLNILGGIEIPDAGKVFVDGEDLFALSEKRRTEIRGRKIGFIFQAYNLIPELPLLENVRLPFEIQGRPYDNKYEDELFEMLELKDRLQFYPGQLSGGQQQRAAAVRALLLRPSIILADEPTGNLDKASGERMIKLFEQTNRELAQTYIIVTHDEDWKSIAHKVFYMSDGRIEDG